MDEALTGLADAVEALRAELTAAMQQGQGERMRFALDSVELTVQAVITREANGKIGWKVFGVGASYEAAATQTLVLRLTPGWLTEQGTLQKEFMIAAAGAAGDGFGPGSR